MNKEHYIKIKKEFQTSGIVGEDMFKYMYEFYKVRVKQRNQPILCPDIESFKFYMMEWLNMPVSIGNSVQELIMNQQPQTINKGIKEMFEYFNKLYNYESR